MRWCCQHRRTKPASSGTAAGRASRSGPLPSSRNSPSRPPRRTTSCPIESRAGESCPPAFLPSCPSCPFCPSCRSRPPAPHARILPCMADGRGALPRTLSFWSSVAVVIGISIGSGIFRSPAGVAQLVANPRLVLAAWTAGGLISLCGALSLAELAAALPQTGGIYAFLREGWGRMAAFLFGWAQLVLIRAAATGGIARAFGDYMLGTLGIDPAQHDTAARLAAAAAIAVAAAANIRGVNLAAAIVDVSTGIKVVALGFLILAGAALGGAHGCSVPHFTAAPLAPTTAGAFGLALVGVLWTYDGFADVSYVAGVVQGPQKKLPTARVTGTVALSALYLQANVAYLYVRPVEAIAR